MKLRFSPRLLEFTGGWRLWAILAFFVAGWLITIFFPWLWHPEITKSGTDLVHEIFIAWTGELLFFSIVGLAVTVISLEKPPDPRTADWNSRVRYIFGMANVSPIVTDFHRKSLESLARYSSHGQRFIYVEEYSPTLGAYRVRVDHKYTIQSAIHDMAFDEKIPLSLTPDKFDGQNIEHVGRVNSVIISSALTHSIDSQHAVAMRFCEHGTDSMRVVERGRQEAA